MNTLLKNIETTLESNLEKIKASLSKDNTHPEDLDKIYNKVRERKIVKSDKFDFSQDEKNIYNQVVKNFLKDMNDNSNED